jgi:hypothetical protein
MTARKGLCPAVVAVDGLGAEWDEAPIGRKGRNQRFDDIDESNGRCGHRSKTQGRRDKHGTHGSHGSHGSCRRTGITYGILPKGARATQTSSLFKL